jgi:hypothetical protein
MPEIDPQENAHSQDDELSVQELEDVAGGAFAEDAIADNTNCGSGNCNC